MLTEMSRREDTKHFVFLFIIRLVNIYKSSAIKNVTRNKNEEKIASINFRNWIKVQEILSTYIKKNTRKKRTRFTILSKRRIYEETKCIT